MEKRNSSDVKLPRAISGYNLYHAECMQSQGTYELSFSYFTNGSLVLESKSCSSLAEKNIYSSAKWDLKTR